MARFVGILSNTLVHPGRRHISAHPLHALRARVLCCMHLLAEPVEPFDLHPCHVLDAVVVRRRALAPSSMADSKTPTARTWCSRRAWATG